MKEIIYWTIREKGETAFVRIPLSPALCGFVDYPLNFRD